MPNSASRSKRLGVLLISDSYPPRLGGSEIEAQRVSAELIARGHRVQVLCSGGPPMPLIRDWVDSAGVPVRILTGKSSGRRKDWVFALEVARAIWRERRQTDVVYFLMQGLHLAAGLPVARLLKKPIVMKFGGSGVVPLMRGSRAGKIELGWLRKWAARLMILNEGLVQEAVDDGFRKEQLLWMPNPVDIDVFRPAAAGEAGAFRQKHGLPVNAPLVIYVGRLSQEKGVPGLIRGFAVAERSAPGAMLVLVGDGPQRSELEGLARELNLGPERVRFQGRVENTEVPAWLRAGDIFALTSPSEGFSCSLLEAMASGLPSVVSDITANRQLVDHEVHGLLAPWNDADAIGAAYVRLLTDGAFRQRLGQAARNRVVQNYSTARVVDRYEQLFEEVMAHPDPPEPKI